MVDVFDRFGNRKSWQWLVEEYGPISYLDAGPPPKFALARVEETEGPAVIKVRVCGKDDRPIVDQPVINHWPDPELPDLTGGGLVTLWHLKGVVQRTDRNGFTGFGLGPGSYYNPAREQGAHTIWVGSPTYASDGITGIGMKAGTNHRGPLFLTFVLDEEGPGEEEGSEELVEVPELLRQLIGEVHAARQALERLAAHLGAGVRTD